MRATFDRIDAKLDRLLTTIDRLPTHWNYALVVVASVAMALLGFVAACLAFSHVFGAVW